MRAFFIILFSSLLLAACDNSGEGGGESDSAPTHGAIADSIFLGGPIWTADDSQPNVEAVAIRDGWIIFAGDEEGARALAGATTEVIDLNGAALYPGFTDAHAHLMGIGMRELTLNLDDVTSIEMLKARLAEAVAAAPGAEIIGRGWIETHWPEGRFPSREDLDEVSPDNPVFLIRADGHAGVLNSRGIELMRLTADTPDPAGGHIQHGEDGAPNGVLIDAAATPSRNHFFGTIEDRREESYRLAGETYTGLGWAALHNMWYQLDDLDVMEAMADDGRLKLRVYNSVSAYLLDGGRANPVAEALIADGSRASRNNRVVTRSIKLYMDGALGSRGALLLEPYSDAPGNGLQIANKAIYMELMIAALRAGIQVNMHAIGDKGNRQLLDWYEEAFAAVPEAERAIARPRWRNEHSQIINPADIPRFAALGVIPSMQPSHAIGDLFFAPDRLGKERLVGAYPWRSLIDAGSIIAGGSDAPVEKGDPRIEFYAAVTRRALDGFADDDWHGEEAVSRAEALKMFTIWPAYASFREDDLGSIMVGKRADFTVFSGDIMTIPVTEILTVAPLMTVIEGEIVFRSEGF